MAEIFSLITQTIQKYTDIAATQIDTTVDRAAAHLRETLSSQDWLPDSLKPPPPPPPPPPTIHTIPQTFYNHIHTYIQAHPYWSGTFALGLTLTALSTLKNNQRNYAARRRAPRSARNEKILVVLMMGQWSDPILRSLAQDLCRRGFIIYITTCTSAEEAHIKALKEVDIRALPVGSNSQGLARERFRAELQREKGRREEVVLTALMVVVPTTATQSTGGDGNAMDTTMTAQFLPLLATSPKPKFLLLTPPANGRVIAATQAFEGFLESHSFLSDHRPIHFKLGTFDIPSLLRTSHSNTSNLPPILASLYGKPAPLRDLHNAVFDVLSPPVGKWWQRSGIVGLDSVVRVGSGSGIFLEVLEAVVRRLPDGWVGGWKRDVRDEGRGGEDEGVVEEATQRMIEYEKSDGSEAEEDFVVVS